MKLLTERQLKGLYRRGTRSVKKQIKKTGSRPKIKPWKLEFFA